MGDYYCQRCEKTQVVLKRVQNYKFVCSDCVLTTDKASPIKFRIGDIIRSTNAYRGEPSHKIIDMDIYGYYTKWGHVPRINFDCKVMTDTIDYSDEPTMIKVNDKDVDRWWLS